MRQRLIAKPRYRRTTHHIPIRKIKLTPFQQASSLVLLAAGTILVIDEWLYQKQITRALKAIRNLRDSL